MQSNGAGVTIGSIAAAVVLGVAIIWIAARVDPTGTPGQWSSAKVPARLLGSISVDPGTSTLQTIADPAAAAPTTAPSPLFAFQHQLGTELNVPGRFRIDMPRLQAVLAQARSRQDCQLIRAQTAPGPTSPDQDKALRLNRASCWSQLGQSDLALQELQAWPPDDNPDWEILRLFVLGSILSDADRHADAMSPLLQVHRLAATDSTYTDLSVIALAMHAFNRAMTGDVDPALQQLEQSLALARRSASAMAEAHALNQQAGVYTLQNRMLQAVANMEMARSRISQTSDDDTRVLILCNLAYVYTRTGEFELARSALHDALALPPDNVSAINRAILHTRLGYLYLTLGDWTRADLYLAQGVSFYRALGDRWRHAMAIRLWATAKRELGEASIALDAHRRAYQSLIGMGQTSAALEAATGIVLDSLAARHDAADMIEQVTTMLDLAAPINPRVRAEAAAAIALGLQHQGRPADALRRLQIERARVDATSYAPAQIMLLMAESRALWSTGALESALQRSRQAIGLSEQLKYRLEASRLGPAWSARTAGLYNDHVDHLLQQYHATDELRWLEEALQTAEQSRFAFLLSVAPENTARTPADLLVRRTLALAADQLAAQPDDVERQLAYQHAYAHFEASLPDRRIAPRARTLTVAQIQSRLQPSERLIYVMGEQVLELDRNQARVRALGLSGEALQRLQQTPGRELRQQHELLTEIGRGYFSPALDDAQHSRILMVPDAAALSLPIAALGIGKPDAYEPVIERFDVVMLPSARHYFESSAEQAPRDQTPSLTIIADPDFSGHDGSPDYDRWVRSQPRLSASGQEAMALNTLFEPIRVRLRLGSDATSQALFADDAAHATILHLATHAYVDPRTGLAGLALADGMLPHANLQMLKVNNALVVINACASASGSDFANEGKLSLSRSFLASGAKSTLSTLWPIADQASARIMGHFYRALAAGQDAPAALRSAQRQMRADRRFRDPVYWGGYQLTATAPAVPLLRP